MKKLNIKLFVLLISLVYSFAASAADDRAQRSPFDGRPEEKEIAIPTEFNPGYGFFVQPDIPPFGASLFSRDPNGQEGRKSGLNPNYRVAPGDEIDVRIWGAKDFEQTTTVDSQGNIFLPEVGPVPVKGVAQENLNNVVKNRVNRVFKDNVQIYTNLRTSLPVSVFVTGAVANPGRHSGISTDSVIDFLALAGGIEPNRGSYRKIDIIRNNQKIGTADLYEFLLEGKTPEVQLRDGDTILVHEKGISVAAGGDVKNQFQFEFNTDWTYGAYLSNLASPTSSATHIVVEGIREGKPYQTYMKTSEFGDFALHDGDKVIYQAGLHGDVIQVSIVGDHEGNKTMVVPKNAGLKEILNHIQVDPAVSDVRSIFVRRRSVAFKQKEAIEESLRRLQESLILARASGTTEKAAISDAEVTLLQEFVKRAKQITPQGKVVVAGSQGVGDVPLENGDQIVVPKITNVVMVNGEILMPKAIIWEKGESVMDYIQKSGGFSEQANESQIVIVRLNGETEIGRGTEIHPGDEIIVLPEVKINSLELAGRIVDIIFKIATSAAIPFAL